MLCTPFAHIASAFAADTSSVYSLQVRFAFQRFVTQCSREQRNLVRLKNVISYLLFFSDSRRREKLSDV